MSKQSSFVITKKEILIAAVALLLVVAIGLSLYFILRPNAIGRAEKRLKKADYRIVSSVDYKDLVKIYGDAGEEFDPRGIRATMEAAKDLSWVKVIWFDGKDGAKAFYDSQKETYSNVKAGTAIVLDGTYVWYGTPAAIKLARGIK